MSDLRKLIEAVQSGTAKATDFHCEPFYSCRDGEYTSAVNTYCGDLNAAKALHEALLPEWEWTVHSNGQAVVWPPGTIDEQNAGMIETDIDGQPARALLLAILRAVRSREAK